MRERNTKTNINYEQPYANNSLTESLQVSELGVRYCSIPLDLSTFYVLGTLPSCNCTLKPHVIIMAVCRNPAMTAPMSPSH